jgi:hypothetical protein
VAGAGRASTARNVSFFARDHPGEQILDDVPLVVPGHRPLAHTPQFEEGAPNWMRADGGPTGGAGGSFCIP